MKKNIGIIGCGNMGRAIAERISKHYPVHIFDKDKNKIRNLKKVTTEKSIIELVANSEAIILAVKPQDFDVVLSEIKDCVENKLVISIAAGIPTDYIEKKLGRLRVIRAMPNLPAKIGKGMICLSKGKFAKDKDLGFTRQLFNYLGKTLIIKEGMMNAATAVSGSGPGFLCNFIVAKSYAKDVFILNFEAAAEAVGFNERQSKVLTNTTTIGTISLLKATKLPAAELKQRVASKGGTTEAGLKVLHKGGTLLQAVKAALKRAKELSRR